MYTVIIVESPTKAKLIQSVLGMSYRCIASNGHFRELDIDSLRIDSLRIDSQIHDKSIIPTLVYKIIPSKKEVVSRIKKCLKGSNGDVILATDDDREGEIIAWHLCQVLGLEVNKAKRIIIHEMTRTAIENAILPINIKTVNMNIVHSQQTRQLIDIIVGYKISPILWERIKDDKKGLSAGRCQTPALRLVYETTSTQSSIKDKHKLLYRPIGYFTSKNIAFSLDKTLETKDEVMNFLTNSISKQYTFVSREVKNKTMPLKKPFTTSYLLQLASSELKISPKQVMESCQKLFENGYITYMRTDGTVYSDFFLEESERYIKKKYGEKYISSENKGIYCNSSPHEPIRPTDVNLEEMKETDSITKQEVVLYKLIHKHSIKSLMVPPINKIMTVCISASLDEKRFDCDLYSHAFEQMLFDGYDIVDGKNKKNNDENSIFTFLQMIKVGSKVPYKKIYCKQLIEDEEKRKFTESSLIGKLEAFGIGRPSTYSNIIESIQKKGYVKKENKKGKIIECVDYFIENNTKNEDEIQRCVSNREFGNESGKLFIQPVGVKIVEFIDKHFNSIFDYEYTKRMECDLDLISKGEINWKSVCERCLFDITTLIDELCNEKEYIDEVDEVDEEKKGKSIGTYKDIPIYIKYGKFGRYIDYDNKFISLDRSIYSIQEKQAIYIIENNYERIIDDEIRIRNGKYSDYIYHKKLGKKPTFYKLDGFIKIHGENSYKTCDLKLLSDWVYSMINDKSRAS